MTTNPAYHQIDLHHRPAPDLDMLIEIRSAMDAHAKHQRLLEMTWGTSTLPTHEPHIVETAINPGGSNADERYNHLPNLRQVDRLTIELPFGFKSAPYLFQPQASNQKLIVYHQGHRGDFIVGIDTIAYFVQQGYAVLAYAMPLFRPNITPSTLDIPRIGTVPTFYGHENFRLLEPFIVGNILRFFMEPIVVGLNYVQTLNFADVAMVGISGGGWSTVMAAAIDHRIRNSYPVAGTSPLYQRLDRLPPDDKITEYGDYEQWLPGIFPELTYFELYILNVTGQHRHQLAIYNRYDPCCFWGDRAMHWARPLQDYLRSLENTGTFQLHIDDTHTEHQISPAALALIEAHLAANGPTSS